MEIKNDRMVFTKTEASIFTFLDNKLCEQEQVFISYRELQKELQIRSRKMLEKALKSLSVFFLRTQKKGKITMFTRKRGTVPNSTDRKSVV